MLSVFIIIAPHSRFCLFFSQLLSLCLACLRCFLLNLISLVSYRNYATDTLLFAKQSHPVQTFLPFSFCCASAHTTCRCLLPFQIPHIQCSRGKGMRMATDFNKNAIYTSVGPLLLVPLPPAVYYLGTTDMVRARLCISANANQRSGLIMASSVWALRSLFEQRMSRGRVRARVSVNAGFASTFRWQKWTDCVQPSG